MPSELSQGKTNSVWFHSLVESKTKADSEHQRPSDGHWKGGAVRMGGKGQGIIVNDTVMS